MSEARRSVAVLVIDDEESIVEVIVEALADYGITAAGCTMPEAVLAVVRRLAPQLVILDVVMPGIDGFEILRQLRLDPQTAAIPVLFLTASVKDLPDHILNAPGGRVELLRKPFDLDVLLEVVEAMLDA